MKSAFFIWLLFSPFVPLSSEAMQQNFPKRPPIPSQWGAIPKTYNSNLSDKLKVIESLLTCGSLKDGYADPLSPNESVSQKVRDEAAIKIKQKVASLLKNNEIRQQEILVEIPHKNRTFYCKLDFQDYRRQYLTGPFSEAFDVKKQIFEKTTDFAGSGLGNIVYLPSYITNVLDRTIEPNMTVLEIGSARGHQAYKLLKKGAIVTAVDLSGDDLRQLQMYANLHPKTIAPNLKIIHGEFPSSPAFIIDQDFRKFDVILMSHVAHYLTGDQLREGFHKISQWLTPLDGKFFFQALTPYANPYKWRMIESDNQQIAGAEWPGWFSKAEKVAAKDKYSKRVEFFDEKIMANYGHPIHPDIIKRELKAQGFEILYINYGNLLKGLSDINYPVTYQDLENYIKRFVIPIPKEKEFEIRTKIEASKKGEDLLNYIERDALVYKKNYENFKAGKNVAAEGLATIDVVQVIARLKIDQPTSEEVHHEKEIN